MKYLISLCEEETAMEHIEVRRVTQNDAVFLQQLMNNDQLMAILHEVPSSVAVWADAIGEWNSDPDEEDYIILAEGRPIGWLGINGLSSESKQVFIKMIALLPTHQGRGIGQYVIREMIENLRLRGFTSLEPYTDLSNVRAQRCYRRCGFETSEKTVEKMSDGTIVDRCKMELSL
jgi:ribosomal protein S18 acetylase RimI-like enzyme